MLNQIEVEKVRKHLKDFGIKTTFNIVDLQDYDETILEKVKDNTFYEEVLNINLSKYENEYFYGGTDIRVYRSTKRNGHYIYWTSCWGD